MNRAGWMSSVAGLFPLKNKFLAVNMQTPIAGLMLLCQLWRPEENAKASFDVF